MDVDFFPLRGVVGVLGLLTVQTTNEMRWQVKVSKEQCERLKRQLDDMLREDV